MHDDLLDCELDPAGIDCIDCTDGDQALAFIWCDAHHTYEWQWVPRSWAGGRA